jgi:PAS domain S-box-containing protein
MTSQDTDEIAASPYERRLDGGGHDRDNAIVSSVPRENRPRDRRRRWGRRWADRHSATPPRVLLVEPHEDTRLLYSSVFEEAGYAVDQVADGPRAIAVARDRVPDLVILEMVVPEADGFFILQQLRGTAATADVPTIVVTGMLHFDVPQRARASGATLVLPKPTPLDVILAAADELISTTPDVRLTRRQLRRSLITLRKLAAHVDREAQERVRALIDRLQVAVLAVDDEGRCLAVSHGFESLTGFARASLVSTSLFDPTFGATLPLAREWDRFVSQCHDVAQTSIRDSEGRDLPIHAAFATIAPGFHAAAFARTN